MDNKEILVKLKQIEKELDILILQAKILINATATVKPKSAGDISRPAKSGNVHQYR